MKLTARVAVVLGGLALAGVLLASLSLVVSGLSARPQPGGLETSVARTARNLIVRWHAPTSSNPVAASQEAVADGRAHFADHCAVCHANDGSGNTEMGRGLYPKAPDMRLAATQRLSDGELFRIIEEGIRFTGMPAWGNGTSESADATWRLVHFIRHLPNVTAEELEQMKALNPVPPEEIRHQIEEERFLQGLDEPRPPSTRHTHGGGHHEP
jgi:mono/diheme cytochrome c family protein